MPKSHNHYNRSLPRRRVFIIVLSVIVVLLVVLMIVFTYQPPRTDTIGKAPTPSMFSFGGSGKWYKGPSNHTSMALFSPKLADGTSACFTSTEYYPGKADIKSKLRANLKGISSFGNTATSLSTQHMTIKTNEGTKKYSLHQYKITAPRGTKTEDKLMGGNELGYLQLSTGYLKIYANCTNASQLPSTLPALRAVTFDASV